MKKFLFIFLILLVFSVAHAARTIDADSIRSSDRTKTWSLPPTSSTIVGTSATQDLSNKTFTSSTTTQALVPSANNTYNIGAAGNAYPKAYISGLWRSDDYLSVDAQNHYLKNGNTFILGWDSGYVTAYSSGFRIRSVDEAGFVGFAAPSTATTHYYTLPQTQGSADTVMVNNGSGVLSWNTVTALAGVFSSSQDLLNCGVSASVAANALTIALKQADGTSDPSTGSSACKIGFRNGTATTGGYSQVSATAATSIVVSSGSTLGTTSGGVHYLMVYAVNNAGTIELAVAGMGGFDEGSLKSTTAEGGAGAADAAATLYSTTARTDKAIRLIGRIRISEATAGTWATAASEVSVLPFPKIIYPTVQRFTSGSGTYTTPTGPSIPLYIRVKLVGGGAGGSESAGNVGTAGGDSTFGSSLLTGSGGAAQSGNNGGLGGAATVSAPAISIVAVTGGQGATGDAVVYAAGGVGGSSLFGGAGSGGYNSNAGFAAASNSGSGGGGAGGTVSFGGMGGGGAGGYVEAMITSPATSYAYAVGAGGAGGTGGAGADGGAGGSGIIIVEEFYQ